MSRLARARGGWRRALPLAALLVLAGGVRPALGGVCDAGLAQVPQPGVRDTNIDAVASACAATAVETSLLARALIDTPEFYGTLAGTLHLDARYAPSSASELRVGLRVIDYRFVQNAVVTASELGVGPLRIGASRGFDTTVGGRALRLAPGLDVTLPLSDSAADSATGSGFLGLAARYAVGAATVLDARLGAVVWVSTSAIAGDDARLGVNLSALLERRLGARWVYGLGAEFQAGWYGLGADHLLLRAGLGWRLRSRSSLGVGLLVPVVGHERTDLVLSLAYGREL